MNGHPSVASRRLIDGTQKRLAAAQVLAYLNALAHNVLVWSRCWPAQSAPELKRIRLLRLVRDLLATSERVELTADGELK